MPETDAKPLVLIVEDHNRQREHLVDELRALGADTATASNATEAIQVATIQRPSVIFLDGLLPGMHGFEVARFLRHIDSTYRPFITLVTAIYKGVRYENEARLKYGIDMYVTKPVSRETLAAILSTAQHGRLKESA